MLVKMTRIHTHTQKKNTQDFPEEFHIKTKQEPRHPNATVSFKKMKENKRGSWV